MGHELSHCRRWIHIVIQSFISKSISQLSGGGGRKKLKKKYPKKYENEPKNIIFRGSQFAFAFYSFTEF